MAATIAVGGGTSGVAASAHAGCERFRLTDPIITKRTRRELAKHLGFPDDSGVIPEARWMKAMLFERLVHDKAFISELMTRGVGRLGLDRPKAVHHVDCRRSPRRTVRALYDAHVAARDHGTATMLTGAVVPMSGFEGADATPVLPDFVVIARREDAVHGSWLIAGDAKDYERIRSRIADSRLLKGFLQVALGAESFASWSLLPGGMEVHERGFLAVPRSAYLRPEVIDEHLDDHRAEVRGRLQRRIALAEQAAADGAESVRGGSPGQVDLHTPVVDPDTEKVDAEAVARIRAEYDPARCVTCSLFAFCRHRLRSSSNRADLLVEIGIPRPHRAAGLPLLDDPTGPSELPEHETLCIAATVTGLAEWTRARRVDPVGSPGTVNVVLVKSDAAALGINGVAVQRVSAGGPGLWRQLVFTEPRTPETRARVLNLVGEALDVAIVEVGEGRPVHLCVPDRPTADILATLADSAAGVEISRLSWLHDVARGRRPLTFDGQPATIPDALPARARLAASFLLDEDRARAFQLRHPVVAVQEVLTRHLVPGGPPSDSGRLDYLVRWAETTEPTDHRMLSDAVSADVHAPGARMTTTRSNELHKAEQSARETGRWAEYENLVKDELAFRTDTMDRATAALAQLPLSRLRGVHEAIEADAQAVWRRRLAFHASDLVRFSLTHPRWRDALVEPLDQDGLCASTLTVLLDPGAANDVARDAGNRSYFRAEVLTEEPLTIRSGARALAEDMEVMAIHVNEDPEFERDDMELKINKGGFAFKRVVAGALEGTPEPDVWIWHANHGHGLEAGDELVIADVRAIGETKYGGNQFNLKRPQPDTERAPKATCRPGDYDADPHAHRWCCQSHEAAAAERSDWFAQRRAKGEMNPEAWPPIIDVENFVVPGDEELGGDDDDAVPAPPDGATLDDIE